MKISVGFLNQGQEVYFDSMPKAIKWAMDSGDVCTFFESDTIVLGTYSPLSGLDLMQGAYRPFSIAA